MGRKEKVPAEVKIKAVEEYLNSNKSLSQITSELNVCIKSFREWIAKYKSCGADGLIQKAKSKCYSKEFKETVVHDYLHGIGSFLDLAQKYGVPSSATVRKWVVLYNSHIELKDYDPKPEVYMADRRKTTKEERIEIVNYCLANNKDYKSAAAMYDVSYGQVYSWVQKYLVDGEDGLDDKRGIHKADEDLDEVELLKRKVARLEKQLELEKDTVRILKKVDQVERRLISQRYDKKQNIK